ncbi:MAG: glycoside hydrolase domain-containing protein [Candidatus Acidiferrales bacterium]
MKLQAAIVVLAVPCLLAASSGGRPASFARSLRKSAAVVSRAFLGFDRNDYPGDEALPSLRRVFAFAGYWLNTPPGASSNAWAGKRAILRQEGFGFLVLFDGRADSQLRLPIHTGALGASDAHAAVQTALREGFPKSTIIFVDQEEGGRLLPEQRSYLFAWIDGVIAAGFRAGVYCSGMAASEGSGKFVITADDIHDHAEGRSISFFVYNDACPSSPGCAYQQEPPLASGSGVAFASIWQFAQSPRRHEFTARCSSTYNRDGHCYPPMASGAGSIFVDLDSATSPDPSDGR